jgi:hypothetical protein
MFWYKIGFKFKQPSIALARMFSFKTNKTSLPAANLAILFRYSMICVSTKSPQPEHATYVMRELQGRSVMTVNSRIRVCFQVEAFQCGHTLFYGNIVDSFPHETERMAVGARRI